MEKINARYSDRKPIKVMYAITFLLVIVFLFTKTFFQTQIWKSGKTLWSYQIQHNPHTATALLYSKYGLALSQERGVQLALQRLASCYTRSLSGDSCGSPETIEEDRRVISNVISWYQRAIDIKPDFSNVYVNLANLYREMTLRDQATQYYEEAIQHDSNNREAYYQLASMLQDNGSPQEALGYYQKILSLEEKDERLNAKVRKQIHFLKGQEDE